MMTWSATTGLLLFLASAGCSQTAPTTELNGAAAGAPAEGEETGTPHGVVGSRVWLDSSVRAEVRQVWYFDSAPPSSSGSRCWQLDEGSLTSAQRAALESVALIALSDACTIDGYIYDQLTVFDSAGSVATYRDTGCTSLRVDGATAMLPPGAFDSAAFPVETATVCP